MMIVQKRINIAGLRLIFLGRTVCKVVCLLAPDDLELGKGYSPFPELMSGSWYLDCAKSMAYTEHVYLLEVCNFGKYKVESDYMTSPNKNPGHWDSSEPPR